MAEVVVALHRRGQRARPLIVDPGLYGSKKQDIFWASPKRELPTAFKLFTGSAWVALSRDFVEYTVWGWDNLPRTLLMYFSNTLDAAEFYFQTVMANSPRFRDSTVNHSVRFDVPPPQGMDMDLRSRYDALVGSGAAFAGRFGDDDSLL